MVTGRTDQGPTPSGQIHMDMTATCCNGEQMQGCHDISTHYTLITKQNLRRNDVTIDGTSWLP